MKLIKTEAAVELELDQASERLLKPFARQAKANKSELYYKSWLNAVRLPLYLGWGLDKYTLSRNSSLLGMCLCLNIKHNQKLTNWLFIFIILRHLQYIQKDKHFQVSNSWTDLNARSGKLLVISSCSLLACEHTIDRKVKSIFKHTIVAS